MKNKISDTWNAVVNKFVLENAVEEGYFPSVEAAEPFFSGILKDFYRKKGMRNVQVQFA